MFDNLKKNKEWFLENINIDAFGKLYGRSLGGLKPGLNIVYGKNESGKTTYTKFVEGVLTGWDRKKKDSNDYKTSNNNRAGTLIFKKSKPKDTLYIKRVNNLDLEIIGDAENFELPEKDDYQTMFSLNSDRLWDLGKNEKELTSQFLTAETGTKIAPATALQMIDEQLKIYKSKNALYKNSSIKLIEDEIDQTEDILEGILFENKNKDAQINNLPKLKEEQNKVNTELTKSEKQYENLKNIEAELNVNQNNIRQIRNSIDEIENEIVQHASKFKKPIHAEENKNEKAGKKSKTPTIVYISALMLCLACVVAGVATRFNPLVMTVSSIVFVVSAIVVLLTVVFSKIHKNNITAKPQNIDESDQELDIELTKLRAQLDQLNKQREQYEKNIVQLLNGNNIKNTDELVQVISHVRGRLKNMRARQNQLASEIGKLDQLASDNNEADIAYYKSRLSALNFQKEQQIKEYLVDIVCKQILEDAIEDWKVNSQPQVFLDAGRFLSIMTGDEWSKVFIENNTFFIANTEMSKMLDADRLSFSTRQQLYLALRIAILIRPESFGKNIPVICDDILVNFDEERKAGALDALYELAKYRQVIMFTCNTDFATSQLPGINFIQL